MGCGNGGQTQSESYLENIKEQLWTLTEQTLIGIDRSELLSGARSLPIKSHTLFYRVTPDTLEIIRVLHARQDPQRHKTKTGSKSPKAPVPKGSPAVRRDRDGIVPAALAVQTGKVQLWPHAADSTEA